MKFGVSIPPFTDPSRVVGWAREAEANGWDGVFLWDHVQWRPGAAPLDPWVMLGALASVTATVRLGTLVTPLSRRRPYAVAKQLTTLDRLSGGRAVLGVGLGEPPDRDFADLGEESDPRVRAAMLDEGLSVVDRLMRGPTDVAGDHYRVRADLHPRPVQQPRPPIWVAGVAPHRRPLARARRWDGIVPIGPEDHLTPEQLADYLALDGAEARPGWDVVVHPAAGVPAQEYVDAGATWLVRSVFPVEERWEDQVEAIVRDDPRAPAG
ncbi:LLM class flavin-dependent oxidoreductase [Ornithinimicrobium kibberense]|uniref:LLM class flavin-dependent oxidoreductase n=1 Tax=Ornithinimicrobium kibberense TaxID=282060 RepID=A0ABV5V619_9MICO|nr:LLM class flavin-dependent oxidoreductase [Ornithinimicrobium kibberense]